jgi:hypothetical protein
VAAFYDQVSDLSNFVISFTPDPKGDFAVFARAYALAADRLASRLLEEPRFSDYEAYPVMFLYRHAFELFLKHIIYAAAVFAMFADLDRSACALKNTHDLPKLSGAAADLLGCLFPHDASLRLAMDSAMQTAREFEEIDPESYSYRYPIDRKGLHSTKRHQVVNLRATASHMSKLLSDLDTIRFGMEIEAGTAREACALLRSTPLLDQRDNSAEGGGAGSRI